MLEASLPRMLDTRIRVVVQHLHLLTLTLQAFHEYFYLVLHTIITLLSVPLQEPPYTGHLWVTCRLIWKSMMSSRLQESLNSWIFVLMKQNIAWRCICLILLKYLMENESMYGRLLAKYVDDRKNFFSVSSDFCHWGSRFNYTHYDAKHGTIYESIEVLDHMGMDIIETGDANAFKGYLQQYGNTICGRRPITVFLHMLKNCSTKIKIDFLQYEQSSQCKSKRDYSVSYASAAAKMES
uniref:Uncharacterized protein n=1 Tax=Musa acuminata subsp. malaccensis TaxID=214687 RepID=A0A804KAU0_MUSAM